MTFISQFSLFFSERWEIISELWLSFVHFWFFNFISILKIFLRILSLHFTTVFAHKELHYNLTIVTFFSVYIWQISEIMASRNPEFTSFSLNLFQNSKLISQFWLIYSEFTFTFMHLADAFIQSDLQLHSGYTFLISICVPWESNLQPFALLTQCSTTEPQEHCVFHRILWKKVRIVRLILRIYKFSLNSVFTFRKFTLFFALTME